MKNTDAQVIRAKVGAVKSELEHAERVQQRKAKLESTKHRLRAASADAAARAAAQRKSR